jgi:hypothetical protein
MSVVSRNISSILRTVILIHEYFLTFTLEVERFWNREKRTWAIFLFFANRYFVLFGHVPLMVKAFWYSVADNKQTVSVWHSLGQLLLINVDQMSVTNPRRSAELPR